MDLGSRRASSRGRMLTSCSSPAASGRARAPRARSGPGGPEIVSLVEPMRCPRCETPVPAAPQSASAGALCPQCGALLPPPGLARRLLAKVTQLARFGLADPADPILKKRTDPPADHT